MEQEERVQFLENQVLELQQKLDLVLGVMPGGVIIHDASTGKFLQISEGLLNIFGCSEADFRETYFDHFEIFILKQDRNRVKDIILSQLSFSNRIEVSFRVRGLMNEIKYFEYRGKKMYDTDGKEVFFGVINDVSDRIAVEQQLKNRTDELYMETQRYKLLQEATDDITFDYCVDTDSASFHMPGLGEQEKLLPLFLKEKRGLKMIHEEDQEEVAELVKKMLQEPQKQISEFRMLGVRGKGAEWYRAYLASFADLEGNVMRVVGSLKNITAEQKEREKLAKKANIDFMTGLLNKSAIEHEVKKRLSGEKNKKFRALMVIDADRFKRINDSLGHLAGDAVIQYVSKQIKRNFRDSDLVGRIGGDEFMVFLESDEKELILEKASAINRTVREPFQVDGIQIQISCSIGVAISTENKMEYMALFGAADRALYRAKENGRDQYQQEII